MLSKYCPACHNFLHKQGPRPGVIGTLLYYIRWTFSWLMFSELLKQLKWNIAIPQPCPHFHWPAHLAEVRLHPGGFLILWVSHLNSESKCFTFENVYLGKVKQMQCDQWSRILHICIDANALKTHLKKKKQWKKSNIWVANFACGEKMINIMKNKKSPSLQFTLQLHNMAEQSPLTFPSFRQFFSPCWLWL